MLITVKAKLIKIQIKKMNTYDKKKICKNKLVC